MPQPIKKYFVKLLLVLLAVAKAAFKALRFFLKIILSPFVLTWRYGLRIVVFMAYRLFLRLKIATGTMVAPLRQTFLATFGHRYVVHVMMALIVAFVSAGNIHARELDLDQKSKQAMIYELIPAEDALGTDEAFSDDEEYDFLNSDPSSFVSASSTDMIFTYDQSGVAIPWTSPGIAETPKILISKPEKYVVEQGDTLSGIAKKYGISINTILWANDMTARTLLRVGQELTVLPVSGILHKVKKGETIGAIAKKYGTDLEKILAANRVASAEQIQIGELLVVPDGKPPSVPVAPRPVGQPQDPYRPPAEAPPSMIAEGLDLVWPTDQKRINQYFKWRHAGIDINGSLSNAIYAVDAGIVTTSGWNKSGYGNMILIDHGNGVITRYGHASKLYVKAGDQVLKGQTIAMIGSTGRSTGPHLHFEIYVNSKRRNPLEYIKR
jgi:murein DD-endopeptidase MepM/ murein hydrolase activator NlpD